MESVVYSHYKKLKKITHKNKFYIPIVNELKENKIYAKKSRYVFRVKQVE